MGTRGLIGYYKKKVTKAMYNHFDSYPSGLGNDVKNYITESSIGKMNYDCNRIKLVNEDDEVTPELVISIQPVWYGNVDKLDDLDEMYSLLHSNQGDLYKCAETGMMIDNISFIKDSLFCEWAYIINLDSNILEIYGGFQEKKPKKNRYALSKEELAEIRAKPGYWVSDSKGKRTHRKDQYYNCDLIAQIPFEMIPNFNMDIFGKMVDRAEDQIGKHPGAIITNNDFNSPETLSSTVIPMVYELLGIHQSDKMEEPYTWHIKASVYCFDLTEWEREEIQNIPEIVVEPYQQPFPDYKPCAYA
jgi:hypothetical protein